MNYQLPSEEILQWADAPLPPISSINNRGTHIVFLERPRYMAIDELYEPEMKLAGIRIHPQILIRSRTSFFSHLRVQEVGSPTPVNIKGLPEIQKVYQVQWSHDETKLAVSILEADGLKLWCIDLAKSEAFRISDQSLNASLSSPFSWHPDGDTLIVLTKTKLTDDLHDPDTTVPTGPVVSTSHQTVSQHRTYQDLLKNPIDEMNFAHLVYTQLNRLRLDGSSVPIDEGMIKGMSLSPDGRYLLFSRIKKPFSYHLPYSNFPYEVVVADLTTNDKMVLEEVPLQDSLPQGFMAVHPYKRAFQWRNDQPATLVFTRALDGGDPGNEVQYRDALYQWISPLDENSENQPQEILKSVNRLGPIQFSPHGYAIATDYWYDTHNTKTYLFRPDVPEVDSRVIFDRNGQDYYGNPGSFITIRNAYGKRVIGGDEHHAYLSGQGYKPDGVHPFIDRYDIKTGEVERVWEAENKDELVQLAKVMDLDARKLIIRRETPTEFPNYYLIRWDQPLVRTPLTDFESPFTGMESIQKEIINYQRTDGTKLHAVLYLPQDQEAGATYPLLMWAYPEEYTDRDLAGQITTSSHEFIYPWYGSPIFWARRGYAVLDNVSFPIVAPENGKSNDTFIEQLKDNAAAAIDAVCDKHPVDRHRVAVGGHSYGAFMTANLLTWTDLFVAGIARSGAYNRSLTPFGFQGEQRTLWEAPELYQTMSPFMHADRIKTPLLLIHGQVDNNSGTHTMQSQRYFDALKSLGADVRLVLLPGESHQYQSRESILHVLWEQDQWLEKHLKP